MRKSSSTYKKLGRVRSIPNVDGIGKRTCESGFCSLREYSSTCVADDDGLLIDGTGGRGTMRIKLIQPQIEKTKKKFHFK